MLNAIYSGKRRGLKPNDATSNSQSLMRFEGAEDLLTASVFERLLYLSENTFKVILLQLLSAAELSPSLVASARVTNFQFWPSLYLQNGQRVEPDCLIDFENCVLIVEAKRWDHPQHYPEQWAREIAAYFHKYGKKRRVYLFAIGGFADSGTKIYRLNAKQHEPTFAEYGVSLGDFDLLPMTWARLWQVVDSIRASLPVNEQRIVDDIKKALELHELRVAPITWLKDLPSDAIKCGVDCIMPFSFGLFAKRVIQNNLSRDAHSSIRNAEILNSALEIFSRRSP